ncbi:MAG: 4Fe-4S dicluster domain-containing protein [Desulfurella sp.]|jgi:tetrathionate reductase subunit B
MKRKDFIKGILGSIAVFSFIPLPIVFNQKNEWNPPSLSKNGRPKKTHNYAMVIVQDRCIGCKACEVACKNTWHIPKNPQDYRTNVLYIGKAQSDSYKMNWLPILCNQCDNPPCVWVCPTGASYKRSSDGIVLVDFNKCIGCKACMEACPYDARYYNEELSSVDKCTFCLPRLDKDLLPACVEACPMHARNFGDLNKTDSIVSQILKEATSYHVLKQQDGTLPNVYYTQDVSL